MSEHKKSSFPSADPFLNLGRWASNANTRPVRSSLRRPADECCVIVRCADRRALTAVADRAGLAAATTVRSRHSSLQQHSVRERGSSQRRRGTLHVRKQKRHRSRGSRRFSRGPMLRHARPSPKRALLGHSATSRSIFRELRSIQERNLPNSQSRCRSSWRRPR